MDTMDTHYTHAHPHMNGRTRNPEGTARCVIDQQPQRVQRVSPTVSTPPLVLIHGIKGCHLIRRGSTSHCLTCMSRRPFLNVENVLIGPCCGTDQFPLPWRYDRSGLQGRDGLEPDGLVMDITCCGTCVYMDMYKPLIEWAEQTGRRLRPFAYDWRRSPLENGYALERFLEKVLREDDSAYDGGVQVVCHSNGALVAFPVVNRRPELFHSFLGVGAAFRGGMTFLPNNCIPGGGNTLGPNTTMFTPRHWHGWTAGYYFLPNKDDWNDRAAAERPHLVEADGLTEVACDFHTLEDWERCRLGPFDPRSGCAAEMRTPANRAFFRETLRQAKAFRKLMVYDPNVDYPPIAVLASDAVATHSTVRRPTPDAPFDFLFPGDPDPLDPSAKTATATPGDGCGGLITPGDGLIPIDRCTPPEPVPVFKKVVTKDTHLGLARNVAAIETLLNEMIDAANARGNGS